MKDAAQSITGVMMILTRPGGAVVAQGADFGGIDAAGFTREQEQRRRARSALGRDFLTGFFEPDIAEAISARFGAAQEIMRELERKGWRVTELPISSARDDQEKVG